VISKKVQGKKCYLKKLETHNSWCSLLLEICNCYGNLKDYQTVLNFKYDFKRYLLIEDFDLKTVFMITLTISFIKEKLLNIKI